MENKRFKVVLEITSLMLSPLVRNWCGDGGRKLLQRLMYTNVFISLYYPPLTFIQSLARPGVMNGLLPGFYRLLND